MKLDPTIHRKGCSCTDNHLSWTCSMCGEKCAPCWHGYTDEDHRDICGVCDWEKNHAPTRVMTYESTYEPDGDKGVRNAARSDANFMPIASVFIDGTRVSICIDQAILTAWSFARLACRDGHVGGTTLGGRCTRCGERKEGQQ